MDIKTKDDGADGGNEVLSRLETQTSVLDSIGNSESLWLAENTERLSKLDVSKHAGSQASP